MVMFQGLHTLLVQNQSNINVQKIDINAKVFVSFFEFFAVKIFFTDYLSLSFYSIIYWSERIYVLLSTEARFGSHILITNVKIKSTIDLCC